jgi:Ala-tRNA(Pro) deacylase
MKVSELLKTRQVKFDVITHPDTYDAQRMAQTLHVPGREVAKTVLLKEPGSATYVVAVLPATRTVDFKRASAMLGGGQLELASEDELSQLCPDCEVGALPPFGSQYGMRTIVDQGLTDDEEIVFEGNSHHEAIRMRFVDFQTVEQPLIGSFAN